LKANKNSTRLSRFLLEEKSAKSAWKAGNSSLPEQRRRSSGPLLRFTNKPQSATANPASPSEAAAALRAIMSILSVQLLTFPEIPLTARILKTSVAKPRKARL
jgi:hypothetical protein